MDCALLALIYSEESYLQFGVIYKLDEVGPVDNIPSTDKLHHIVKK